MKKIKIFIGNIFDIEENINEFLCNNDVEMLKLKTDLVFTGDNIAYTYTVIYEKKNQCKTCSSYFKKSNVCTYYNSDINEDLMRKCEEKRGGSDEQLI